VSTTRGPYYVQLCCLDPDGCDEAGPRWQTAAAEPDLGLALEMVELVERGMLEHAGFRFVARLLPASVVGPRATAALDAELAVGELEEYGGRLRRAAELELAFRRVAGSAAAA
jgi:hypothetical protein